MSKESTLLLKEYIKALILNVNKNNIPKDINLIFDGGAFSGAYATGVGLYIKALEDAGLTKVHKVSGTSAGCVVALLYLTNFNPNAISYFEKIMQSFKNNMNLKIYQSTIIELVNFLFAKDNVSILNKRLYINYYDTKKHKQVVVCKYKSNQHLIDCILRSSHIPYLIDGNARYNDRYIDGMAPYIFKEKNNATECSCLFIKLLTFKKCARAFMVKDENNIHYRLITGLADANDFFITGKSDMCSYVSKWSFLDIFQLHSREALVLFIFSLIEWLILLKNMLPSFVKESLPYNGLKKSCSGLLNNIIRRTLL